MPPALSEEGAPQGPLLASVSESSPRAPVSESSAPRVQVGILFLALRGPDDSPCARAARSLPRGGPRGVRGPRATGASWRPAGACSLQRLELIPSAPRPGREHRPGAPAPARSPARPRAMRASTTDSRPAGRPRSLRIHPGNHGMGRDPADGWPATAALRRLDSFGAASGSTSRLGPRPRPRRGRRGPIGFAVLGMD